MGRKRKEDLDFVQDWLSQIDLGLKYKDKFTGVKEYRKYRDWFRGEWDLGITRPVNRTFSTIKSMIPRIYFRSPTIVVTPLRPEFKWHAKVLEAVDNWLIRETNIKMTLKRAAIESCITGLGSIKLGYDSEFGYIPDQAVDQDMATATQTSTKENTKIEYRDYIKPGLPWAMPVLGEDVITPFGYKDPETFPWIAHMILRPLKDVQEDQKYRNTKDLKGGFVPSTSEMLKRAHYSLMEWKDVPFCLLYEIRDKKSGKIFTICEETLLMDYEDALQIEGLPWEFVMFNEDPEYFGGISDIKMIAAQQEEMNEISTQASSLRKFSLIKFLYQNGALKPESLDKLLSSNIEDIGIGIPVEADSLQAAILPLQPHGLTAELQRDHAGSESIMRETLGMGSNQMGEMSPYHGKSAAEAMITNEGAEQRVDERRDHITDVLTNIIRKFNQYIIKYWTTERVTEIVGPDQKKAWVTYTGDQLKGEYAVRIDAESGLPVTRGLRHEQAMKLFELLKGDPFIDQIELRRMLMQPFEWIDPSYELMVQEPPPSVPGSGQPGMQVQDMAALMKGGGGSSGAPTRVTDTGGSSAQKLPFEQLKGLQ